MAKRKFSPADDPWNSSASAILLGTALFAFAWAVTRACTQTIIGDEADSYLYFARQGSPNHWFAAANNHVINSMLMRLFTSVFGL